MMERLLKDPLLHFFLIGACLFAVYAWIGDGESEEDAQAIVVTPGRIEQLSNVYVKTWQRPPTEQELEGLIDNYVLEEAYCRSAIEMGLDQDDTIVRRRLRQKLEFLLEDAAGLVEPTDEDLAGYLNEHVEQFRSPTIFSFDQVFVSPEKHRENPQSYANEVLAQLLIQPEREDVGDASLLPASLDGLVAAAAQGAFGGAFGEQLHGLEIGKWGGPIESAYGLHLVRIREREDAENPTLAEVREEVLREWRNTQRIAVKAELDQSLLKKYKVVVEWPEVSSDDQNPETDQGAS